MSDEPDLTKKLEHLDQTLKEAEEAFDHLGDDPGPAGPVTDDDDDGARAPQ